MRVCSLNARSVCNKTTNILELLADQNIDVLALTETWIKEGDITTVSQLTSGDYLFLHKSRPGRAGGGVGVLYRSGMRIHTTPSTVAGSSFEHIVVDVDCYDKRFLLMVVYRAPNVAINTFLSDFSQVIEQFMSKSSDFVIVGDFNIQMDQPQAHDTMCFINFLESCNLIQHVVSPTHIKGHVLDLVITRSSMDIIKSVDVFDPAISDHSLITCSLEISKPVRPQRSVAFRRIKNKDCEHFRQDIRCSALSKYVDETSLPDPNVSAAIYSSELSLDLDKHAPFQSKIRSNGP